MKVKSSSGNSFYDVTPHSSTCFDYKYRQAKTGGKCKHMLKAFYKSEDKAEEQDEMKRFFRGGVDLVKAFAKYGDEKIDYWLNIGDICKSHHEGKLKFYLLE